jgi:branched-chain amino acid transport system permease protein
MLIDLINVSNVVISGILTGLVYGLMALGLSVIFGVARVVNFAHGGMMTVAMYAAVMLFAGLGLDPFLSVVPVAAGFFVFGYVLQRAVINPFITRPEHSQFMLLLALAVIMTNLLLIVFGPGARSVQLDSLLDSIEFGPLLVDRGKFYAALVACATSIGLFGFFRFTRTGTAVRACADN